VTRRPGGYGWVWPGIGGLTGVSCYWLLSDAPFQSAVGLGLLGLLPALFFHLAVSLPTPLPLVVIHPSALWAPYTVGGVLAGIAVRLGHENRDASALLAVLCSGLFALAVGTFVARMVRASLRAPTPVVRRAACLALAATGLTLVAAAAGQRFEAARPGVLALPAALALVAISAARHRGSLPTPAAAVDPTLDAIARGMAHTLRKPLAAVAEELQVVLSETACDEHRARIAEAIGRIMHADRSLRDLLDLSRGQTAVRARLVSLRTLVDQAVMDTRMRFPESVIELECDGGHAFVDEVSMRCTLLNLLENALEAGGPRGWVRISTRHDGETAHIEVEDRSGGLPSEVRERLFQPFVTTKPQGTGLGLAIVREITRAHGGAVFLEETSEGARFVLEVPARPRLNARPGTRPRARDQPRQRLPRMRDR
jgi:signal transduction histidine kinase